MKTVNVAELKDRLSAYLDEVEKGEDLVIVNRKRPVARMTRIDPQYQSEEDSNLVAEGKMTLPQKTFSPAYLKRFLAWRKPEVEKGTSLDALTSDRTDEER